jgi:hypothetical protein
VKIVGAGDDEMLSGERYRYEHILLEVKPRKKDDYDFDKLMDGIRKFVDTLRLYSSNDKDEIWDEDLDVCIMKAEEFCRDVKLKENPMTLDQHTRVIFIDSDNNLVLAGRRKNPISIRNNKV